MVVARKDTHEAVGVYERLHEGCISARVLAILVVIADVALKADKFFVDARSEIGIATSFLVRAGGMRRDVNKGQAGDNAALSLCNCGLCKAKPSSYLVVVLTSKCIAGSIFRVE